MMPCPGCPGSDARRPARRRLSPEEVEELMVPKIVEAIYPILIPMEQQDCAIQARNHERMTKLARQMWRSFSVADEQQLTPEGK